MRAQDQPDPEFAGAGIDGDFRCYFPVGAEAVARGFYLTGAGEEIVAPGYKEYPRCGHPSMYGFKWEDGRVLTSFTLIYCLAGGGQVETTRGRKQSLETGRVLLLPPGVWHRYRPERLTGWRVWWVKVAGHMVTGQVAAGGLPPRSCIRQPTDCATFRQLFGHLLEEAKRAPNANAPSGAFQAMALIGLCTEDSPRPGAATPADPASGDALVDAAVHHIWNHGHRVLDVPTLAATVGVCRRTLETRFLRARGCSILEEINRTRLERAEELLANTILPVADVAGLSGFGSTEAMRKTFLQHRGIRPSDIRRGR